MSEMLVNRLAPWFGSDLGVAASIGKQLGKLAWFGVPFVGGASIIPHIKTRGGVAADLHRHIINLARVIRDDDLNRQLVDRLDRILFHPDELAQAQRTCRDKEDEGKTNLFGSAPIPAYRAPDVEWAAAYFCAAWMGRGGHAGKRTEFSQNLSTRWTASGGDSAKRFRSMIESLVAWQQAIKLWSFELCDVFDFLQQVEDVPGHGLYIDAPWPEAGDEYLHGFTNRQQERLRDKLAAFQFVRIVIRYGDHPLIRHLYSASRWHWDFQTSRTQQNTECEEILIINSAPVGVAA